MESAKPVSRLLRLVLRNRLPAVVALIAFAWLGCGGERRAPASEQGLAAEPVVVGPYALGGMVLYRMNGGATEALAALPGDGPAPDTLTECGADLEGVMRIRFQRLTLSPDSAWAAWETSGPGACVGVLGPVEPPVTVLGRWLAARSDSVLWAPTGHYLAIWLVHPHGRRSLRVFDGFEGQRLEMPWDEDCAYVESCDVERVTWLGGTLLNVEIRLGPAELSVPFEVNVQATPPVATKEED